jgi:hypothetical protein
MKPKNIFAVYGSGNVGKSSTIEMIFELLTKANPTTIVKHLHHPGADISVLIKINGKFIGLESQGDPNSRLAQSLQQFRRAGCSIVVCATRNWGGTVAAVQKLEPEFKVTWHHKKREPIAKLQDRRNKVMARIIFNQIKKLL